MKLKLLADRFTLELNWFCGCGRASNDIGSFSDASTRVTQGLGFRYKIACRYGFDMGIDIARGPEESVFYITAGPLEANNNMWI